MTLSLKPMPLQLRCDDDSSEVFFFADNYDILTNGPLEQVQPEKHETPHRDNNDDDLIKPPLKKRRKSLRSVHFSTEAQHVLPHLHFRDMSEEEKFSYWMSREELQQTRYEAVYTSSLIRRSLQNADESVFSMRGLEPRDLGCICAARSCVLSMPPNEELHQISNLYRVQTQDAEHLARLRGISDAEEAMKCEKLSFQRSAMF
mmetsp:Transcript_30818/g.46750  ORF Transcript_30818/g.46750 Transcript_30818/m.46750 type:complete len:203 (-) Transcript_30818:419-1027(-)|eukprot:CAMPEP_0178921748 /NCGR_PEP_ID=MMETSP0786-20121207/15741_1 /TAXON_ID=186022 /ORGANISM="Thalassionema frauenfeldii, Strain CCMP 1798" /LENGTH=202 /DNA_ID=CAMNT_0020595977 /DNA_START=59 /DNA_END=667 /DNA_ORIENTATION=+